MTEGEPKSPIDGESPEISSDRLRTAGNTLDRTGLPFAGVSLLDISEALEEENPCPRGGDIGWDDDHMMCCSAGCIIVHTFGGRWRHATGD